MPDKKSFYITTTLPYVNADPHIGFAFEIVMADAIARYRRDELKEEVFFSTGTDEHGLKIYQKALAQGKDPQLYVDEYVEKFLALKIKLGIHEDLNFIRTTNPLHIKAAMELWNRCFANKYIYPKKYKGLYCIGDEAFIKETELVNGRCPNHPNVELQEIEEENYFFKLTALKQDLERLINKGHEIKPEWAKGQASNFLENLEDISISRDKSKMPWGIPVPNDDTQVMYVWFDALTSYLSTLGWPDTEELFDKFWVNGETLQLAGKDQVRFQSIIWQAMLFAANLEPTKKVFYHGFVTSGGHKMSKSLGNVINPDELLERYKTEATRYLLLRHIHPIEDTDVTWKRLDEWYESHLVNGLGNLVSRIMKLAEDNLVEERDWDTSGYLFKDYPAEKMEEYRVDLVMEYIWAKIGLLDKDIQEKKPWESKDKELIEDLVLNLYRIGRMIRPFMPETSKIIIEATKSNKKPENLFPRINA
ncbi:methionine--tRNA ligase [Candidatus Parcubacteria bacterium]|nr:methionine--tRNA ligase [Candidatus Parcubacteria bacterium]